MIFRCIDTTALSRKSKHELRNFGFYYCQDLEKNLNLLTDEEVRLLHQPVKFENSFKMYEQEILNGSILSYNEGIDELLRDITRSPYIIEIAGQKGSGKTQICLQLCISVQLPKWCGGIGGEALYICTNKNVNSSRVRELAKRFLQGYCLMKTRLQIAKDDITEDTIMENIHYTKISSADELTSCISSVENYLQGKNIHLMVIDSITQPLKQMEIKSRLTTLNQLFQNLRYLSNKCNLTVVLTNDLTTRIADNGAIVTPSFGDSFYHMVNTRILLSKNDSTFHGKLVKSMVHGLKERYFRL